MREKLALIKKSARELFSGSGQVCVRLRGLRRVGGRCSAGVEQFDSGVFVLCCVCAAVGRIGDRIRSGYGDVIYFSRSKSENEKDSVKRTY